jgi:hypothetical protein
MADWVTIPKSEAAALVGVDGPDDRWYFWMGTLLMTGSTLSTRGML